MPIKDASLDATAGRKHPVPQNVMDVEFKVVWDLTVRQVMYLFFGGAFVFVFQRSGLPPFWRWILMVGSGFLSIAVAFVPVQERGLDRWIISFIRAMKSPAQMVWRKSYSPPAYFVSDYAQIIRNEIITLTPAKSRSKLDEYLDTIPTHNSKFDKTENMRLSDITKLYSQTDTQVVAKVKREENIPSLKQIQKSELKSKDEFIKSHQKQKPITSGPIDRTMANLPSELKGEISIKTKTTLPSTIKSKDLIDVEKEEQKLQKSVRELLELTKKAKLQFSKENIDKKHKSTRLEFFKKKHKELQNERVSLANKLVTAQSNSRKTVKIDKSLLLLQKENKKLENALIEVQKEINTLKESSNKIIVNEKQQQPALRPKDPETKIKDRKPVILKSAPNHKDDITVAVDVIHGTVKDQTGQLIENAVIIVKDEEGDVVRALQTNKLGAFQTQTALPTGKYTVEIVKGKFKFDIISVDVNGKVLPPVYLVAKS